MGQPRVQKPRRRGAGRPIARCRTHGPPHRRQQAKIGKKATTGSADKAREGLEVAVVLTLFWVGRQVLGLLLSLWQSFASWVKSLSSSYAVNAFDVKIHLQVKLLAKYNLDFSCYNYLVESNQNDGKEEEKSTQSNKPPHKMSSSRSPPDATETNGSRILRAPTSRSADGTTYSTGQPIQFVGREQNPRPEVTVEDLGEQFGSFNLETTVPAQTTRPTDHNAFTPNSGTTSNVGFPPAISNTTMIAEIVAAVLNNTRVQNRTEEEYLRKLPRPHTIGSPMFDGKNATDFLRTVVGWYKGFDLSDEQKIENALGYCEGHIEFEARQLAAEAHGSWSEFQRLFLRLFRDGDTKQQMETTAFLEHFCKDAKGKPLRNRISACRTVQSLSLGLRRRGFITERERVKLLLSILTDIERNAVMVQLGIDLDDPHMIDFNIVFSRVDAHLNALRSSEEFAQQAPAVTAFAGILNDLHKKTDARTLSFAAPVVLPGAGQSNARDSVSKKDLQNAVDRVGDKMALSVDKMAATLSQLQVSAPIPAAGHPMTIRAAATSVPYSAAAPQRPRQDYSTVQCYGCGQMGHTSNFRGCPAYQTRMATQQQQPSISSAPPLQANASAVNVGFPANIFSFSAPVASATSNSCDYCGMAGHMQYQCSEMRGALQAGDVHLLEGGSVGLGPPSNGTAAVRRGPGETWKTAVGRQRRRFEGPADLQASVGQCIINIEDDAADEVMDEEVPDVRDLSAQLMALASAHPEHAARQKKAKNLPTMKTLQKGEYIETAKADPAPSSERGQVDPEQVTRTKRLKFDQAVNDWTSPFELYQGLLRTPITTDLGTFLQSKDHLLEFMTKGSNVQEWQDLVKQAGPAKSPIELAPEPPTTLTRPTNAQPKAGPHPHLQGRDPMVNQLAAVPEVGALSALDESYLKSLWISGSPYVPLKINQLGIEWCLFDTGAEVSIIREDVAAKYHILHNRRINMRITVANNTSANILGMAEDVTTSACGVEMRTAMVVVRNMAQGIILGRPWQKQARARLEEKSDCTTQLSIHSADGSREVCIPVLQKKTLKDATRDDFLNRGLLNWAPPLSVGIDAESEHEPLN